MTLIKRSVYTQARHTNKIVVCVYLQTNIKGLNKTNSTTKQQQKQQKQQKNKLIPAKKMSLEVIPPT